MRVPSTVLLICTFAHACLWREPAAFGADFPVGMAPGDQSVPDVACAGGTALVVWQDERNASIAGRDVYAARVSIAGAVLDPAGMAVSGAGGPQACPKVASDGSAFLVVWQDDSDENTVWQVRAARVTVGGATPDGEGVIVAQGLSKEPHPDVVWAGSHYLVAWQQYSGATGVDVYVARVGADGSLIDATPVLADGAANDQDSISAANGAGSTLLVYRDKSGSQYIRGMFVDADASPSPAFLIADAASTQKSPAVAFGGGLFLVTWEDWRAGNPDIYAARVEPDGNVIEDTALAHLAIAVSFDASEKSPAVTFDGGAFVVVWQDDRDVATVHDVYFARVGPDGQMIAPGAPVCDGDADQVLPSTAAGSPATVFAWADERHASSTLADVYACLAQTNETPVASASFSPTTPSEGDLVTLDAAGSSDPENAALSCRWAQVSGPDVGAFEDTVPEPDFTAPEAGASYDLVFSLEVSDGCTWSEPDEVTVAVDAADDPPVAVAVAENLSASECETVTLDGGPSYDPEGESITFSWSQEGAPAVTLDDPESATPSFTAPDLTADYTLTFTLSVRDATQASAAPAEVTVSVAADNDPPTAEAGEQITVPAGSDVTLDGGASHDPEGKALVFNWTQVWGPEVSLDDPALPGPRFTAPASDSEVVLVFLLTVRDDGDIEDSDRAQVWVSPGAIAAPVGSGFQSEALSHESARVTWSTDIEARGRVEYGTTPALGLESDGEAGFATSHEIVIEGLRAGAKYHFVARSTGTGGAWTVSDVHTFTLPAPPASDDSDGDGIPDQWETENGLDPDDPGDASFDPDGDGLSNLDEYRHGTDPDSPDTDLDGATDGYEVRRGTSPLRADSVPPPVVREESSCGTSGSVSSPEGVLLLVIVAAALAPVRKLRRRRA